MTMTQTADMGDVYDDFANKFAESDKLPSWRYVGRPAMINLLRDLINDDTKILDLGSASARVEAMLIEEFGIPAENLTGVEISPEQVEIAKQRIPKASFMVGDIREVDLPSEAFDVVFSHMVFEHIDDAGLLAACKVAHDALVPGGTLAFVVTHPGKMTDMNGNLVKGDGHFVTTAPWGGELDNWRRGIGATKDIVAEAGFRVESVEELQFPDTFDDLTDADLPEFEKARDKYQRYPAIRLALKATKL